MVTRTSYAGTATTGLTHLASHDNSYPGGWIGYAEATSSQTVSTTDVDLTGLSVAVTVGSSRRILITGFIPAIETSVVDARFILKIRESTTTLAECTVLMGRTAASFAQAVCMAVETPSSGSHTYKLTGTYDSAGSGQATLNSSAAAVAFILVQDVGPSS